MKAWELERKVILSEVPCYTANDNETIWEENASGPEIAQDNLSKMYWHSQVPGSRAKESICLAAIQATENKGMIVENGMELIEKGYKAYEDNDIVLLHKLTYQVFRACDEAKKDEKSPYWDQEFYDDFTKYSSAVNFAGKKLIEFDDKLLDQQYAGWLAQIIGGAYGTCIEGYTGKNIREKYGVVDKYIRKPNTYNDDITYELALLLAYDQHGKNTTALDIADEWISRIPTGWSAEDFALRNLKAGILPPESGRFHNPFNEWIGAQMRGAICGQLYPANPYMAAKSAFMDASISHCRNGIIGEVFNAVLVSMAFVEKDIKKLLQLAIEATPVNSEYGRVVRFAYQQCLENDDYIAAWDNCEEKYQRYNWIHSYPNAAAEVIALYYGQGNFTDTLAICGGCGQDVDCNAAQIATVIGVCYGSESIDEYWKAPIGDNLDTYVRGLKQMSIRDLAKLTFDTAKKIYEY
ncbi:MAG: ADP-ribosylglycohydrolase family protein [Erysipelotrichaceae bacterium]